MFFGKKLFRLPLSVTLLCLLTCSFLVGCNNSEEQQESGGGFQVPEGLDQRTELRFKQYAVQGRQLYKQHCANCHKDDGSGLAKLIPPLAGADFLKENQKKVACIIRWGLEGSVVVNRQEYNQPMPANPQLTDIEIAEIMTYIYNAWGNKGRLIPVKEVQEWLNECPEAH